MSADFDNAYIVPSSHPNAEQLQVQVDSVIVYRPSLSSLFQKWDDAQTAGDGRTLKLHEQIDELKENRAGRLRRIAFLGRQNRPNPTVGAQIDAEIAAETAQADKIAREIQRKQAAAKASVSTPLAGILAALDKAEGELVPVDIAVVVPNGSTATAEFDKRIASIKNCDRKIADLRATSPTLEELLTTADSDIIAARDKAERPNVAALFNYRPRGWTSRDGRAEKQVFGFGGLKWPTFRRYNGVDFEDAPDTDALFRHVFHEQIREYIHAQIKARYDDSKAMSAADRNTAIATIESEKLDLWYQAGAFALLADDVVKYPDGMPPLAIVGFNELPAAPKVERAPGKPRMHVDGAADENARIVN